MSSVLGLNDKPHTAKVFPDRSFLKCLLILSGNTLFCLSLTASTDCSRDADTNFLVWPQFVSTGEELVEYAGHPYNDVAMPAWLHSTGLKLIFDGKSLLEWIALARVPMPVSTDLFSGSCAEFNNAALSIKRPKQQSL